MNIKKIIADSITDKFDGINYEDLIIESISEDKGDYCLPCFSLSKLLRKNPNQIAQELAASVKCDTFIEKVEIVNGYLNFFLNKEILSEEIIEKFKPENLNLNDGNNKIVTIDYGSPNLAKYLHIGHLKTTIIGECLARLFTQCGYQVKRLNYIGDYGTPFGKIIGGMKIWGSIDDVKKRGNDALQEYYVKFNQEEANNPELSQYARDIFKKIEEKDSDIYPIYEMIIDIALKDAKNMFDILGVHFDDYRGEMYYSQFVPKVLDELREKKLLITSEDAQIVDLSDVNLPPAVILKNDGTSLYITRDISAVISRLNEYKFDKMIYVTDIAQILHFKQLIKIIEKMGYEFYQLMEHVPYGRFSLPDGKISSRKGKQAILVDLLEFALNRAKDIIKDRKFEIENPNDVANKVARAVLNFSVLRVERIKDCIFDTEKSFSFDGETAPYMQYTYTRLESILRKYEDVECKADYSCFNEEAFALVKAINDFTAYIRLALEKRDASIMCKRIMDMCKTFNKMYTTCKILDGNNNTSKAKVNLVRALRDCLKVGFYLICIDTLQEM